MRGPLGLRCYHLRTMKGHKISGLARYRVPEGRIRLCPSKVAFSSRQIRDALLAKWKRQRKPLLQWRIALAYTTAASMVLHPKDSAWGRRMLAKRGGKARAEQASFERDFERGRKIAASRSRNRWAKMRDD